jgi:hypothetical protein
MAPVSLEMRSVRAAARGSRGLPTIEQMFYPGITQHISGCWRLTAVETDQRSWTAVLTRTLAMLFVASLLILVLLPAALAASSR